MKLPSLQAPGAFHGRTTVRLTEPPATWAPVILVALQ